MATQIVVATRHPGALQWIREQGIRPTEIIRRVKYRDQVEGKIVIGILPFYFAIRTRLFGCIYIPDVPMARKNDELTYEEMKRYNARIEWYQIQQVDPQEIQAITGGKQ